MRKQLTGEPVAGKLHTGFGGRGRPKSFPTPIDRADHGRFYQFLKEICRFPRSLTCELRMLTLSRVSFWVRLDASADQNPVGEPVFRMAIIDIDAIKRSEESLSIAATSFETRVGKLVTSADQVILRVNQAFTTITGYTEQEVLGKTPSLLKSGRHGDAFYATIFDSIARTGAWRGEIWNRNKKGEIHPQWMDIHSVKDKDERITHYVGSFGDISETVALRTSAAAASERLQALFDSAINSILLTDDAGHYLDANPAACRLLGYTRDELHSESMNPLLINLLGYTRDELLTFKVADLMLPAMPDPSMQPTGLWHHFMDSGRQTGRASMLHRDGHLVIVEYAAVSNIQPGVHLSVLSDVTNQVKAQAALVDLQQRLQSFSVRQIEEFDHLRGELARDLHDGLGQNLTALKLEIDLIAGGVPDAAQRMHRLVRESFATMRDVSRALRPVTLELGLATALRVMAKELSMRSDLDIAVQVSPELPSLSVSSELAMYRIAQEALSNATNHARASTIALNLGFENGRYALDVFDNGQGFDADDNTAHRGLGLVGMAERVRLIGGEFRLVTAPGCGTRIQVWLNDPVMRSMG
jgi:PAS domain S-box-containing protein